MKRGSIYSENIYMDSSALWAPLHTLFRPYHRGQKCDFLVLQNRSLSLVPQSSDWGEFKNRKLVQSVLVKKHSVGWNNLLSTLLRLLLGGSRCGLSARLARGFEAGLSLSAVAQAAGAVSNGGSCGSSVGQLQRLLRAL